MSDKEERWRAVPSFDRVMVSSLGRVMVIPYFKEASKGGKTPLGGKPIYGQWDGTRYIYTLKRKSYKVARLVCEAFHGSPPFPGAVCIHIDENSRNNTPENLKWGTQKENLNAPGFLKYCRSRTGDRNPMIKGRALRAMEQNSV